MGIATQIPANTFNELQMDAGILLSSYDISKPFDIDNKAIITATTGGIKPSTKPSYSDLGEDVDNCPANMKELMHLDSTECTIAGTGLGFNKEFLKLVLGSADIQDNAVIPRTTLKQDDFTDIWWVGDIANGGLGVIQLKNALSTDGLSLQSTKNGKGQISFTFKGHFSLENQTEVPMKYYVIPPATQASAKKAPTQQG